MFNLYYHVENNGDGSASARFHTTLEQAENADENQDEGWGESTVDVLQLEIKNNKIVRKTSVYSNRKKKYETVWVPLEG